MIALKLGKVRGTLSEEEFERHLKALAAIPAQIAQLLDNTTQMVEACKVFRYAQNFLYLGRGFNFPVALEGALKLKEISYIHAEGYPAAEMKHGLPPARAALTEPLLLRVRARIPVGSDQHTARHEPNASQ